jgi:hypothetical protein
MLLLPQGQTGEAYLPKAMLFSNRGAPDKKVFSLNV